jgi:hypothetical protein
MQNSFLAFFEENLNKLLDQLNISRISGLIPIRYPALPDIRQSNLVSGWIPDIKKGRIIRPDDRISGASLSQRKVPFLSAFC